MYEHRELFAAWQAADRAARDAESEFFSRILGGGDDAQVSSISELEAMRHLRGRASSLLKRLLDLMSQEVEAIRADHSNLDRDPKKWDDDNDSHSPVMPR